MLTRWYPRRDRICIALRCATDGENHALQNELERDYLECGCTAGKHGMTCGFIGGAVWAAVAWMNDSLSAPVLSMWAVLTVGVTMVAKSLAIWRARRRLSRRIKAIVSRLGMTVDPAVDTEALRDTVIPSPLPNMGTRTS
jgi:hypothetical protein